MTWASSHNGGRTQIGLNFFSVAGSCEVLNLFKGAQSWFGSNVLFPDNADSNGYPSSSVTVNTIVYFPSQSERSGTYKATWSGSASVTPTGGTATINSGSASVSGYTFTPNTPRVQFQIIGTPTDLKMYFVSYESRVNAGEIWDPDFLAILAELKPGIIRAGDWLPMNTSNLSTWALRKPTGYYTWRDAEFRSSLYVGATGYVLNGSSNDYSVNIGGTPSDKQTLIVKFNASSAGATNTFSIDNGTTKLPILRPYGDATVSSGRWPVANKLATLVFDSTLNGWLKFGGDGQDSDQGVNSGVPVEMIIDLCATVGAHPHFPMPYLTCDPIQDYASSLATYIRDNGPSWMIPTFEGPNETWNSLFYSTSYGKAKQAVRNGNADGTVSYSAIGLTWTGSGASGSSTITIGAHSLPIGAHVNVASFGGVFGFSTSAYVTAVTATEVIVDRAPTSGTYTSGGTVSGVYVTNTTEYNDWYGQVCADIGREVSGIYGDDRGRYRMACGVQTESTTSSQNQRMSSRSYVLRSADATNAASDWITHVCVANYVRPTRYNTIQELLDGYAYTVTYSGNYVQQLATAAAYQDTLAASISGAVSGYYSGWKTWAQGFGVNKILGYEGGYNTDYGTTNYTSPVTGATKANPCVVTLATTSNQAGSSLSGNAAVVGMTLSFASVGGMTQLNGNSYTVTKVGVAGGLAANEVEINVDATGFGAFTSGGTATYVNSSLYLNTIRYAGKLPQKAYDYQKQNIDAFMGLNGSGFTAEYFSQYFLSGSSTAAAETGAIGSGQVWGMFDPTIFDTPSQSYDALRLFNNRKRRFRIAT